MMGDVPVLLQPCCPPPDDPEMVRLIEALRTAAEAVWAEIELRVDGSDQVHHYRCSETRRTTDSSREFELDLGARFSATLRLGRAGDPDPGLLRLASFTLDKILSSRRLREQVVLLRGALDTTTSSILLFDSSCDIVYANPPADLLLSRQTEDALVVLRNDEPVQPLVTMLCRIVDGIASNRWQSAAWRGNLKLSDGTILACEVLRVALDDPLHSAGVLVHIQTVDHLAARFFGAFSLDYRLSPREEEVTALILEGLGTAEIAERLGISPHTVRDHVKHVYRKTGTTSRSELLGLVAGANATPPR